MVPIVGDRRATLVLLLILCSVLLIPSFPLVSAAEDSPELWSKTYGSDGKDASTSLVQTSDGGYALAGFTYLSGNGDSDALLVKTDGYGNLEWNKTIAGPDNYNAASLIQTSDGGFALAGYTHHDSFADLLLIRTDNLGNMLWNQSYSGRAVLGLPSLVQTMDAGFALSGAKGDFESGDWDFWLVKTDEYGVPEFPSWIILVLGLLGVTIISIVYRRGFKQGRRK
jgi:hypothetical protein